MRHSKEQLVLYANEVMMEIESYTSMIRESGLKGLSLDDQLASLPHPSGSGSILCGAKAVRILEVFANAAAEIGLLSNKISPYILTKETHKIFSLRFIKEKRTINTREIDRFISAIIRSCKKYKSSSTHLIPCHLMDTKDPESFTLGPVKFHNKQSISKLILSKRKLLDKNIENDKFERNLLARALRYYRKFNWVAEVRIEDCDSRTADKLAVQAVTASLDCLHILLGISNTSKMQVGGFDIIGDRRASLKISTNNEIETSLSYAYQGEVIYSNGWSKILSEPHIASFKELLDIVLAVSVDPNIDRPLSRRYLDAAQWFGEAVRDTSASTRIVKFVTALERLLTTDDKDDICSLIAQRVSVLCFCEEVTRFEWERRAKAAYDLRSRLVHGSISPNSYELNEGAVNAGEIAQMTMRRALEAFGPEALTARKVSSRNLSEWYQKLMVWAESLESS